jgi:hypothetical protein
LNIYSKGPAPGGGADTLELSSLGGVDGSDLKPPRPNGQIKFQDTADLTCASMRANELRCCLIREISRGIAVGRLAQEALLDGDDDEVALANLRWHWRVIRAGITPLACELAELAALRRARAVP